MTKLVWLLVLSPTILLVVVLLAGLVPPGFGGAYAAFAIVQVMFLWAAFERIRLSDRRRKGERVTMPMWQKIVLAIFCAYALVLYFFGALTKQ